MGRKLFITGTDTGVGKTVVTSLLLAHARAEGLIALAMKPFCSGGTGDVDMILALQGPALTREEVNPFFFPDPVAPLVAARSHNRNIPIDLVTQKIKAISSRCDLLLIEGAGGLLAPLGEDAATPGNANDWKHTYNILDVARRFSGDLVVVALNKLGVINHTLLTLAALAPDRSSGRLGGVTTVLNEPQAMDESARTNGLVLQEAMAPAPLVRIPFLPNLESATDIRDAARKLGKPLESVLC